MWGGDAGERAIEWDDDQSIEEAMTELKPGKKKAVSDLCIFDPSVCLPVHMMMMMRLLSIPDGILPYRDGAFAKERKGKESKGR